MSYKLEIKESLDAMTYAEQETGPYILLTQIPNSNIEILNDLEWTKS